MATITAEHHADKDDREYQQWLDWRIEEELAQRAAERKYVERESHIERGEC